MCSLIRFSTWDLRLTQGNLKKNQPWQPSCHHIWRWVIVPLDFVVVKLAKQFRSTCFAFPAGTYITHSFRLPHGKHVATMSCANCAKSEGTITRLHTWPSKWPPPHSVNTWSKRDLIHPFKFLGFTTLCWQCSSTRTSVYTLSRRAYVPASKKWCTGSHANYKIA